MKDLFIQPNSSIKEALRQLDRTNKGCLVVVNKRNKLLGTLTDGDVRRVILKGKFLKDKINGIYEKNPTLSKIIPKSFLNTLRVFLWPETI